MLYVTSIEAAKARDKQYKLTDVNGLHLLINPNGSKLWRFRYRFGGKQLMLSLGAFPDVSLSPRERSAMRPGGSSPLAKTRRSNAAKTSYEPSPQARTPSGLSSPNSSLSSRTKAKRQPQSTNRNGFSKTLAADLASPPCH